MNGMANAMNSGEGAKAMDLTLIEPSLCHFTGLPHAADCAWRAG